MTDCTLNSPVQGLRRSKRHDAQVQIGQQPPRRADTPIPQAALDVGQSLPRQRWRFSRHDNE
jgi:hypothetical protein